MGRLMLGETNRYCSFDRKVRIHDCNGGWSWVLCLLCMADNNTDNRSCKQRHEKDNHQADGPIKTFGPRYDKVTREAKYSFKN